MVRSTTSIANRKTSTVSRRSTTRSGTVSSSKTQPSIPAPSVPIQRPRSLRELPDGDDQFVGILRGAPYGTKIKLPITTTQITRIGASDDCDCWLYDRHISRHHLTIQAFRTNTDVSMVCILDASTNGYSINEIEFCNTQPVIIHGHRIFRNKHILLDGDILGFPGTTYRFKYTHNPLHGTPNDREQHHSYHFPSSIFTIYDSTKATYKVGPWIIHNFQLGSGTYAYVNVADHEAGGLQVACKTIKKRQEDQGDEDGHSDAGTNDSLNSNHSEEDLESLDGSETEKPKGAKRVISEEIKILKRLCHPNVIGYLDVIEEDKEQRIHMIMEVVIGGDLFSYMEKHRSLTEDEVIFAAFQLCKAVSYLHRSDVAHRDIKPENILLATGGAYPRLLITDFGHAKTLCSIVDAIPLSLDTNPARVYEDVGTREFIPRERLQALLQQYTSGHCKSHRGLGEGLLNGYERRKRISEVWMEEEKALDSWALGCTLFTCCVGYQILESSTCAEPQVEEDEEGRTLSGAEAWARFRTVNGESRIGEVSSQSPDTPQAKEIRVILDRVSRLDRQLEAEFAEPQWANFDDVKGLIRECLQIRPSTRLKMAHSEYKNIFVDRQPRLNKIYDNVIAGKRWDAA